MGARGSTIRLKRAYEKPATADGCRVLVDRVWPRGETKAESRPSSRRVIIEDPSSEATLASYVLSPEDSRSSSWRVMATLGCVSRC